MNKILFFDIDGTLVNFDGVMPASTASALAQARRAGHHLVICSGRTGHQLPEWTYKEFDGIINSTGARVVCDGQIISEDFMPSAKVKRVRQVLTEAGGVLVGQTEACTVSTQQDYEYMIDFLASRGRNKERINNILGKPIITSTMEDCPQIKKFVYHRLAKRAEEIAAELGEYFTVEPSSYQKDGNDSGEITRRGINKSYGMKKYLDYYGLSKEDAIAFGDAANDVDMLVFAGIGVVMGNGREEVKAWADFVTKDVNADGIAYAMKKLGLIG